MNRATRSLSAAICLFALAWAVAATPAKDADIAVRVRKIGDSVVVDVDLPVRATAIETWDVMTDYDNMARFVSTLRTSRVIERRGNTLIVLQKGRASHGPLTLSFENTREIVLTPPVEVRSRLISGDLQASEFTTRVVDNGDSSEIVNHGEFIPNLWVPPLIGPAIIEAETRKQFAQLRDEIMRRKAEAASRP
jgi:polyketide cyclase/dehydrase/lipid transport protein